MLSPTEKLLLYSTFIYRIAHNQKLTFIKKSNLLKKYTTLRRKLWEEFPTEAPNSHADVLRVNLARYLNRLSIQKTRTEI
ncbi:MAG: hypothetical protein LDLANPLL_02379 [Turneriella sp.]|nr:hypothetical protein [Turneriella sp.]